MKLSINNEPNSAMRRQKILIVLGCALGLGCGFGPMFYSVVGIFLKPIASSFNWSRADISLLPMLGIIGTSIGAPFLGYIADRRGWKTVNAFSVGAFPLGMLAIAFAPPSQAYIMVAALLTGILGAATTAPGYIPTISRHFDRRLGLAMGVAMVGSGLSSAAMPLIVHSLLNSMDWRFAYACLACASLVLGIVAHQIVFRSSETVPPRRDSTDKGDSVGVAGTTMPLEGLSLAQAVRTPRFWLIGLYGFLVTGSTLGAIVHLPAFASDRGISSVLIAQSMGLIGIGLTVARIAAGLILDRYFAPFVALGVSLIAAAGFAALALDVTRFSWGLPLAAILLGVSAGAEGDIIPFLARKYFGVSSIGGIFGVLFTLITIGGAAGAYAYGVSFDIHKSYLPVLQLSGILCGMFGFLMLALGRYRFGSSRQKD